MNLTTNLRISSDSSTTLGPQEATNFIAEFVLDPVDAKSYRYDVSICLRLRLSTSRHGNSQAKHPVRAKVGFFLENAHEKYMTMKNENLRSNQGELLLHLMTVRIPKDAKVSSGLVVLSLDQKPLGAPRPPPASASKFPGDDAFSTSNTESASNNLWNDNLLTGYIRRDPQAPLPILAPRAESSPTLAPGAEYSPTLAPGAEHSLTLPAGVTSSQAASTSNLTQDDECICE
ncbi:hypothetical protein ACEPAF_4272 [Sanghuangporus sanghuang]